MATIEVFQALDSEEEGNAFDKKDDSLVGANKQIRSMIDHVKTAFNHSWKR